MTIETRTALVQVLRDTEAVMARHVYPKPDVGPDHPWSVLQRLRAALAALDASTAREVLDMVERTP